MSVVVRLDAIGRDVTVEPVAAEVIRQYVARRDADVAAMQAQEKSLTQQLADMKKCCDDMQRCCDEMKASMDKLTGQAQASEAAAMDAKTRADAAEKRLADPAELRKILAPRVALETTAREVLPKDQHARIDAMSDDEVRSATVSVLLPSLKLEGVKGDRLVGLYEGALATRQARTDARPPVRDPKAPDPQQHERRDASEMQRARINSEYVPPGQGRAVK